MACPICKNPDATEEPTEGDLSQFACPRCGLYRISRTALDDLDSTLLRGNWNHEALLSHFVGRMQTNNSVPILYFETLEQIIENETLPNVKEQADRLVRWLGDSLPAPGQRLQIRDDTHSGLVGAVNSAGLFFVVAGLKEKGLIDSDDTIGASDVTLTFNGWQYYEDLKRGGQSGQSAFMAMQFGNQLLDDMFEHYFRRAVAETGYQLRRLDDEPRAGLIDDRLRVEIQNSRFIIADLTYDNNGAYWEAGYAEGLGKPVIYTCESTHFTERRTHFDTNHHLTVIWNNDNPEDAVEKLKATIRATIAEAKQTDGRR